jgi:hypothetical protein
MQPYLNSGRLQHFLIQHKSSTIMKKIKLGTNFTIFVLFFGVSMLEAFQSRNWLKALFWLVIGLVFLAADVVGKKDNAT